MTMLGGDALHQALQALPGWKLSEDARSIRRRFSFRTFPEAFAFMTRVAFVAEKIDHHPDWSNSHRHVDVALTSHDIGGLTERDLRLASAMEKVFAGADRGTPQQEARG
jgi:4a-hydroxytetrahydrobiopterin dehydratase